jgi:hypothetical protein
VAKRNFKIHVEKRRISKIETVRNNKETLPDQILMVVPSPIQKPEPSTMERRQKKLIKKVRQKLASGKRLHCTIFFKKIRRTVK